MFKSVADEIIARCKPMTKKEAANKLLENTAKIQDLIIDNMNLEKFIEGK